MAKQIFSNNASALLAASITNASTTIQVSAGYGALFPSPSGGDWFMATLENSSGDIEVVKCTSRTSDLLTVQRGQEGTTAQSWTAGQTRVELRLTKGSMEQFVQRSGDTMSGDLDMDGNDIIDAVLTGSSTRINGGQIVNVPIRGVANDTSNQIVVPTNGTRATASGSPILTQADTTTIRSIAYVVGMITLWYGSINNVPAGWSICDGTNGTPDLRGRFVIGVSNDYAYNSTGGSATASGTTSSNGAHTHTGSTGGTTLTINDLPAHNHQLYCWTSGSQGNAENFGAGGAKGIAGNEEGTGYSYINTGASGQQLVQNAGTGSNAHTHSISSDGAHTHTLSNIATVPPYRALYYIMYTG
jgi:hypothetical protein